jgi:hypothetical protein
MTDHSLLAFTGASFYSGSSSDKRSAFDLKRTLTSIAAIEISLWDGQAAVYPTYCLQIVLGSRFSIKQYFKCSSTGWRDIGARYRQCKGVTVMPVLGGCHSNARVGRMTNNAAAPSRRGIHGMRLKNYLMAVGRADHDIPFTKAIQFADTL